MRVVHRLSSGRAGFDLCPVHLTFFVDKVGLGDSFLLSLSLHMFSMPVFIFVLSSSEEQAGEVWEPSKRGTIFPKSGATARKFLFKRGTHTSETLTRTIQGVTGGTDQTSGECSLGQTIPI